MKVIDIGKPSKKGKFKPFLIAVETQDEANYFASLVGSCPPELCRMFNLEFTTITSAYHDISEHTKIEDEVGFSLSQY